MLTVRSWWRKFWRSLTRYYYNKTIQTNTTDYKSTYPRKEMYNGKVINKVPIVCLSHSWLQI